MSQVIQLARNSEKVKRFLKYYSIPVILVELNESTRTSQMAADVLGCSVAQIAKSIVFVNSGDKAVVVVISGDKRVDDRKLSKMLGHKVTIADADAVRKYTGYAIGGVPPFPHNEDFAVFLDSSLSRFEEVWTSAGTPNSVFKISVEVLKRTLGTEFVEISN
ncbi:YbaK/EbsC family protein [Candidatus Bathyarchaeota archaeon]|nr:YbaK/EbsC family protein [Candidatus Bathyarchaeota archaeon]